MLGWGYEHVYAHALEIKDIKIPWVWSYGLMVGTKPRFLSKGIKWY